MKLLVRNGRVIDPAAGTDAVQDVLVQDGTIATITMNRPERRNALSLAMMRELITATRALAAQPPTRAIILAGNGPAVCRAILSLACAWRPCCSASRNEFVLSRGKW